MRTNAELEAENAELKAEVAMLAVAAKAARAGEAATGGSGRPLLTRRALEALPVSERYAAVRSHTIVD